MFSYIHSISIMLVIFSNVFLENLSHKEVNTNCSIKGVVVTIKQTPISDANVIIFNAADSLALVTNSIKITQHADNFKDKIISSTKTDLNGNFHFSSLNNEINYLIKIEKKGFQKAHFSVTLPMLQQQKTIITLKAK